jgi:UDP-glucose 4-epimerase
MSKTKILVTGGMGFIGSNIARKLAENKDNYLVIADNMHTGHFENLPKSKHSNIKYIKADTNFFKDISSIFYAYKFDYVFHYAALVGVKRTIENPVAVLRDLEGIRNVLGLSKNTGVKRVFFSSSSEVYGEPVEFPQNEYTTPLNSRLPYAIVKNVGEAFLRSYKQEYDLDYTIFRFFNTYGPNQSEDFVMSRFIRAALKNKELTIYGDGSQTRTFCYVEDNVDACLNAFYKNKFVNDIVNIGTDFEITILDLAKKIIRLSGSKSKIVHLPPLKEGDMTRRCPDVSNMKKLLGRKMTGIDEGIRILIKEFRNRR